MNTVVERQQHEIQIRIFQEIEIGIFQEIETFLQSWSRDRKGPRGLG